MALFLLHDAACSGRVTLEDAMRITYLRVGKVGQGRGGRVGRGGWPGGGRG